jgi:hypothetical protein
MGLETGGKASTDKIGRRVGFRLATGRLTVETTGQGRIAREIEPRCGIFVPLPQAFGVRE